MKKTNKLIHESSPYLLQHAYNPVDWYPWGEEALEKAKKENKIILVSIGYSACHWCHVMEHETFEDMEAAAVMNEHFVCIKVDREERPDIDVIYMTAVQMITGSGGWPLNCFALPDGKPFYGGTYFRKHDWLNIMKAIAVAWNDDPGKISNHAEELSRGIVNHENVIAESTEAIVDMEEISRIVKRIVNYYDMEEGGTRGAPKFPLPVHYEFLLQQWWSEKFQPALNIATLSLDKMGNGGIFDQLEGGFARYSVDAQWHVPHFEKMLYDNAQLISLYSKAFKLTGNEKYSEIVSRTIGFIISEFQSPLGGFYSALDADSEGVEGKYYTWTEEEVDKVLGSDSKLFKKYYNIEKSGNWEETNILFTRATIGEFARSENLETSKIIEIFEKCRKKLLTVRNKRIKPRLDDKIITAWNGLMIKALCDAYMALGNADYLDTALRAASFSKSELLKHDFSLFRTFKNNHGKINAFLDDYAMLTEAFIALYEVSFVEEYLHISGKLIEYVNAHFLNKETGFYFYTSDLDVQFVTRTTEIVDNVIPSSNSVMAFNLFRYGHLTGNMNYIAMAEKMAGSAVGKVTASPLNHMNWLRLFLTINLPFYEIAVTGPDANVLAKDFHGFYYPSMVLAATANESTIALLAGRLKKKQNLFYICRDQQCDLPVEDVKLAVAMLQKN